MEKADAPNKPFMENIVKELNGVDVDEELVADESIAEFIIEDCAVLDSSAEIHEQGAEDGVDVEESVTDESLENLSKST